MHTSERVVKSNIQCHFHEINPSIAQRSCVRSYGIMPSETRRSTTFSAALSCQSTDVAANPMFYELVFLFWHTDTNACFILLSPRFPFPSSSSSFPSLIILPTSPSSHSTIYLLPSSFHLVFFTFLHLFPSPHPSVPSLLLSTPQVRIAGASLISPRRRREVSNDRH